MNKQYFLKHFGKITALPILVLVMILNFLEFNVSDNQNSVLMNLISLFILMIVSYFIITKFYIKNLKIILAYFIISLLFAQNLFINLSYQILEKWNADSTENIDQSSDFLWIIVLPSMMIFVFIWGFLFDKIKNTK